MKSICIIAISFLATMANAGQDYLIKLKSTETLQMFTQAMGDNAPVKTLNFNNWVKVNLEADQVAALANHPDVLHVEKNMTLSINSTMKVHDPVLLEQARVRMGFDPLFFGPEATDNPDFPEAPAAASGSDPDFSKQWGMSDIGVEAAWQSAGTKGLRDIVVAVIDTGVDYTHEDLVGNMWRNPGEAGELATNGLDDDGNGYVDDYMGWDFAADDNKPYDLAKKGWSLLLGGNPGHGTHCAGNVAAQGDNGVGIAGVAPNVQIMAMRFISESGQGTTEAAVNSIKYAVDNGAHVLSNSWGSEGDGGDAEASRVLQEAIEYAQSNDVLFVAAAGNGHQGVGYDNDTDAKPAYPASYDQDVILSVAALDEQDQLGSFSNWGPKTVDIGAPGVKVFSTVPDNDYQDTVINIPGLITATWDGTSMAAPHVAGAAALYLSANPGATFMEVKEALLDSATPISALDGKAVSNGKLDVEALMAQ